MFVLGYIRHIHSGSQLTLKQNPRLWRLLSLKPGSRSITDLLWGCARDNGNFAKSHAAWSEPHGVCFLEQSSLLSETYRKRFRKTFRYWVGIVKGLFCIQKDVTWRYEHLRPVVHTRDWMMTGENGKLILSWMAENVDNWLPIRLIDQSVLNDWTSNRVEGIYSNFMAWISLYTSLAPHNEQLSALFKCSIAQIKATKVVTNEAIPTTVAIGASFLSYQVRNVICRCSYLQFCVTP